MTRQIYCAATLLGIGYWVLSPAVRHFYHCAATCPRLGPRNQSVSTKARRRTRPRSACPDSSGLTVAMTKRRRTPTVRPAVRRFCHCAATCPRLGPRNQSVSTKARRRTRRRSLPVAMTKSGAQRELIPNTKCQMPNDALPLTACPKALPPCPFFD